MENVSNGTDEGVLDSQWRNYREGHRDRSNLLVHALTQPLFTAGLCALPAAVLVSGWLLPAGVVSMALAIAAQGATHRREHTAPAPFRGGRDVAIRLLAEQLVTFPRYVLSGEFGRAWRAGAVRSAPSH